MDPGLQLYLIILLIYLSDCLWYVPRRSWLLSGAWPDRLRARFSSSVGNERGGLSFLFPLPGTHAAFELQEWPFSSADSRWMAWTPETLTRCGRSSGASRTSAPSESSPVAQGQHLVVDGVQVLDARGEQAAVHFAELLPRPDGVAWAVSIDPAAIRARAEEALHAARFVTWSGLLQFLCMFGVAPLLVRFQGLTLGLIGSAVLVLACAILNAALFFVAHRRLYPAARGERLRCVFTMIVSFPLSARAADLVTRRALLCFQAPAVVAALSRPEDSAEPMQHWQRDLQHPIAFAELDGDARELAQASQVRRQTRWDRWWQDDAQASWRLSERRDVGEERLRCPRCLADYPADREECADCSGVALEGGVQSKGAGSLMGVQKG